MKLHRRRIAAGVVFGLALAVPFVGTLLLLDGAPAASKESIRQKTKTHQILFQVNSDDPAMMKYAITGSLNALQAYNEKKEPVDIEIVAYGAGIHMFRTDTSPVRSLLALLHAQYPAVVFSVCGNTKGIMERTEGHSLALVEGARVVDSGITRIVELQETGWSYLRP